MIVEEDENGGGGGRNGNPLLSFFFPENLWVGNYKYSPEIIVLHYIATSNIEQQQTCWKVEDHHHKIVAL